MNIKMKYLINVLVLLLVFILIFSNVCFASLADWSDEEADKQTEQELEKQQKEDKENLGKSSNNFLSSLKIEGYKLEPDFDKQVINYTINVEKGKTIYIEAIPEDERAKVSGAGSIEIKEDGSSINIVVKAENGVERTYFIKTSNQADTNINKTENNSVNEEYMVETTSNKIVEGKEEKTKDKVFLIAVILIVFIFLLILFPKKKKNKKRS